MILLVTVSVPKFHAVVSAISVYHPANVYPSLLGSVGLVMVLSLVISVIG